MMTAIFAFVVACVVIAAIDGRLPEVIGTVGYLLSFLGRCLLETALLLGKGLRIVAVHAGKAIAVASIDAWLFATVLLDEWRGVGAPEPESYEPDPPESEPPAPAAPEDPYAVALRRLGLSDPFTLPELKRVYRQAMKTAHTDTGGTKEAAQALNLARDLVMQAKGWR